MGLGLVLGGAAQGYQAAEKLQLERDQDKRAAETHDEEMRKARAAQAMDAIVNAKRPKVGETYDAVKANPWDTFDQNQPAPAPKAGLSPLGKLEHRILPNAADRAAAAAQGKAPDVASSTGLAMAGAGSTTSAAPTPPTGGIDMSGGDGGSSTVDPLVVTSNPQKTWTDADENAYLAKAYALGGEHTLAAQYGDKAMKSRVDEQLKLLAQNSFSLDKLANTATEVTGKSYDYEQGKDGSITVTIDGEPAGTYRNRQELVYGAIRPMIDGNLGEGFAVMSKLTEEARLQKEADSNDAYRKASLALDGARVQISKALAGNQIASDAQQRQLGAMKLSAITGMQGVLDGSVNPLLIGDKAATASDTMATLDPSAVYDKTVTDPLTGAQTIVKGNKYDDIYQMRAQRAQADYQSRPEVKAGLITTAPDPRPGHEGEKLFRVKGSDDGYTDLDAAVKAVRKLNMPQKK